MSKLEDTQYKIWNPQQLVYEIVFQAINVVSYELHSNSGNFLKCCQSLMSCSTNLQLY